jgi:hypothetical protein
MNPRLTNKKLVKALMDVKGIDMITVSSVNVLVQVSKSFTPAKAEELCKRLGHTNDVKAATKEGLNYMIFPRY